MSLIHELTEKLKSQTLTETEIKEIEQELAEAKTALEEHKKLAQDLNKKIDVAVNDKAKREHLQEIDVELDKIQQQRKKPLKRFNIGWAFSMFNLIASLGAFTVFSSLGMLGGLTNLGLKVILSAIGITGLTLMPITLAFLPCKKLVHSLKARENELVKERLELIEGQSFESIIETQGEVVAKTKLCKLDRFARIKITPNEQVEEDSEINTSL